MHTITAKKLLSFLFIVFLSSELSYSQQNPVDALKKYYDDYPEEKIYLWFNKTAYIAGETIWFKAYIFSGYDLSFISSSLFVELYDAEKRLLGTKLLPVISGVSEGSIDIDSKLDEGVYYARAYTTWMLNFKEKFQFIQPLLIYNSASTRKLMTDRSSWQAVAIPEGGSLISGIETKVAVRRYATAFLDTKWGGYLYEESNPQVKIKEFNSLDENVSLFSFTPEPRKRYFVYIKDEKGAHSICSLPLVKGTGVNFRAENFGDSISCHLKFQDIPGGGNGYRIIGEIQHQLVYHATIRKEASELMINIPTKDLYNGILHLTFFDPLLQVVAERLVFINPSKLNYDSLSIIDQTISFQSRAQNKLLLKIDSVAWISYAITIEDDATGLPRRQDNILSALWLTGDLTNPVQNSSSYFEHPDNNKINALDALLISEKWTRFDWQEIINNKYPVIKHLPYRYLSYTGKISRGKKLKPNEEVNLVLYFPDSTTQFLNALSDSTGNVSIDNVWFMNEAKIFYQLNSKKYAAKLINIDFERNNQFVPYSLPLPSTPYKLVIPAADHQAQGFVQRAVSTISMEKDIELKYKTLEEVVVRAKIKTVTEKLNEELSSGLFNSGNEIIFDFVNEQQNAMGYFNIIEWLQGRVAGLTVSRQNGEYIPLIRGSRASLYIDEIQADPTMVGLINISDIAMIKIIKGPFALMTGSGGGTIAIYTARGNMRPAQREPALPSSKIKGYDTAKKFFSPYYDIKSIPQPDTDTRDLLLWQSVISPTIDIDKSRLVFFNNDNAKRFKVIIQGINENGFPVYVEKIIELVQKAF